MFDCSFIKFKHADKICHIVAGFLIAALVAAALYFSGFHEYYAVTGLVVGILAGCVKEYLDYFNYGKFDFFDLFATVLGSAVGAVLFDLIVKRF